MRRWAAAVLLLAAGGRGITEDSLPSAETLRAEITRLGHERYVEREAARDRLKAWTERFPRSLIPRLAAAYAESGDMEVRHRLAQVLREPAIRHLFLRPDGFMGVRLGSDRLADGSLVIVLEDILAGRGAERAGLKDGDRVVEIEGRTPEEVGGPAGFSRLVAGRLPGSRMELLILRGDRRFRAVVELGVRDWNAATRAAKRRIAEEEFEAWLTRLTRENVEDPAFPVGHYPSE